MCARIIKVNSSFEGPLVLSYTRQGIIPHIAQPSTISPSSISEALYIPLEHFIDMTSPSTAPSSHRAPKTAGNFKNIHEYCALPAKETLVVAGSFEPTRAIKKKDWVAGSNKALGFIASSTNRILVTPNMLKSVASLMRPNVLLLADPSIRLFNGIGDHELVVPALESSASQERKAHNRWIKYLEELLSTENAAVPDSETREAPDLLAEQVWICVGGSKPEGIKHSCLHIIEAFDAKVAAYGICLPTLPHRTSEDTTRDAKEYLERVWSENADTFLQHAPKNKPRFLLGLANFKSVVLAISKGFDVLDDSWIEKESMEGKALFVNFDGNQELEECENVKANNRITIHGKGVYTFDLTPNGKRETKKYGSKSSGAGSVTVTPVDDWKLDMAPLSKTCGCWTCTRPHSRAYIHHLLCVNDMLAYVMLQHHNLFQMHQLVNSCKASIIDGSFDEKSAKFIEDFGAR